MDLVRLGLERARSAAEAVDVMTGLLTECGQGGIADAAHQEAYDSSFLIADPHQAYVLDTAGSDYAVAPFPGGTAISNRITLGTGWTRASAALKPGDDFGRFRDATEHTAYADVRLAASRRFLDVGLRPAGSRRPPPRPTCVTTAPAPGVRPAPAGRSSRPRPGSATTSAGSPSACTCATCA